MHDVYRSRSRRRNKYLPKSPHDVTVLSPTDRTVLVQVQHFLLPPFFSWREIFLPAIPMKGEFERWARKVGSYCTSLQMHVTTAYQICAGNAEILSPRQASRQREGAHLLPTAK